MSITGRLALKMGIALLGALVILAPAGVVATDLTLIPLATEGFLKGVDGPHPEGSRLNSYAQSMAWFKNSLFVGTLTSVLSCLGFDIATCPYLDLQPQIWRYTPAGPDGTAGTWKMVYQSPLSLVEKGYRNMNVCDAGDGVPRLFVANLGSSGRILFTRDGQSFRWASVSGLDLVNDKGYRAMVCWKRRLYISPAGMSGDTDTAFNKVVLVNGRPFDPFSRWRRVVDVANDPVLGNPDNLGIFSATIFEDSLILGVTNRTTGFEIWKAGGTSCHEPPGPCELVWEKIVDKGAGRQPENGFQPNAGVADFAEHNGNLYVAVADSALFKATTGEIIRFQPGLITFDLIMGQPRDPSAMATNFQNFNCNLGDPDGLGPLPEACLPLSGRGPGFGGGPPDFAPGRATYVWRFQSHTDDYLYAGTFDIATVDFVLNGVPVENPGFDLLRTKDGTAWSFVNQDGFGNPCNYGLRTMVSTSLGLFFGTANPFADQDGTGVCTGGAEVWLGK